MGGRFTVVDVAQRTPEWFAARLGKVTGSKAGDMLAKTAAGKEAAGRKHYRTQLVLERITGRSHEREIQTMAMQQGMEREADAVGLYEALTGTLIRLSGFLVHQDLAAGCSLDGYVGDYDGIIEVKSPLPATHLEYLETGRVPKDYMDQCIHGLWITGARWCDWLSYNPDFPDVLRTKLVRIERDEEVIRAHEAAVKIFLQEVDDKVAAVRRLMEAAG